MVERQTRKLEVLVGVTPVRVQIPPSTPEFSERTSVLSFLRDGGDEEHKGSYRTKRGDKSLI